MRLLAIDPGINTGLALFEDGVLKYAERGPPDGTEEPDICLIELPQVYRGSVSKVDPNDLIALAVMVGRYWERMRCDIRLVRPAEWKGQLSKKVVQSRLRAVLLPEELKAIGEARHDVWDAVGLGRWYIKGAGRPGVF